MGFLFRLLLLVVLVVGLVWFFRDPIADRLGQRARAEVDQAGEGAERAGERVGEGAERVGDRLDLDVDRIGEELKQTGRVVRRKTAQAVRQIDDATRDSRTTAKIKARLALDPDLSAREIGVDTSEGRVTLSGRVDSADDVARAIQLAMQEDDVVEVTSTIRVARADQRPASDSDPAAPASIPDREKTPAPQP